MSDLNIKDTKVFKLIDDFPVEIELNGDTALLLEKLIHLKWENLFNDFIGKLKFKLRHCWDKISKTIF